MDGWQVAQNYLGFAVLAGGVGGYYYYTTKRSQPAAAGTRRRSTNDFKVKPDRRLSVQQREPAQPSDAVSEKQEKQRREQEQRNEKEKEQLRMRWEIESGIARGIEAWKAREKAYTDENHLLD